MKLTIQKPVFIKRWNMAERITSSSSSIPSLGGVLCTLREGKAFLHATDLKTSFTCTAEGVSFDLSEEESEGNVVFPTRVVGDLFKKASTESFTVSVEDGKALMRSGKNIYRFTTYPKEDFPKIPSAENARPLCKIPVKDLLRLIEEGSFAGSTGEEYPQYLSGVSFRIRNNTITLASTDIRRITLSRGVLEEFQEEVDLVLPVKGLRELQRVLGMVDHAEDLAEILVDDTQVFCRMENAVLSLLRMDVRFPSYENLLERARTTWMTVDRDLLLNAMERLDILVRDGTRMVIFQFSPAGECTIAGFTQNVGAAVEHVTAEIDGEPLQLAFNSRFLLEGLKALHGEKVQFSLNGSTGQLTMFRPDDESYRYVVMPIDLQQQDHERFRREVLSVEEGEDAFSEETP
ncbi:MAG TPA: DNA polymerase III subunit beta [Synergistaceae bacterium]|nr:DNA polymerase III subunit beta [Synergistaceae bacterium]HPQ36384.1 DNA polymerase III subunit beta [Synergistaceae bacterium]